MKTERLCCERCEAPLPTQKGKGRSQSYCSPACKKAAYRQRRAQEPNQCEYCGKDSNDRFCSDRCYYYGRGGIVPLGKQDLAAYNEWMIPRLRRGQIMPRPPWHGWVYGGAERPKPGSPAWKGAGAG